MKLYFLLFTALTSLLFSCTDKENKIVSKLLNENNLQSQFFTININRDTVLQTAKGCIIQIPKGSLQSDSENVKLEIKEALSNTDIVLAGLSTMSGKQALSSGGMIYFNAAKGYKVEIKKQLAVLMPTKTYNRDMKVFKGDSVDGKINWTNPLPLPEDETTKKIDQAKNIYTTNCANCHSVYEDKVAPALYGITERKSNNWLYVYTRHKFMTQITGEGSERYSASDSSAHSYTTIKDDITGLSDEEVNDIYLYHSCQSKKYGAEMTAFSGLSQKDIEAIYTYIKYESDKRSDLKEKFKSNCCDSCINYFMASREVYDLQKKREALIKENDRLFSLKRDLTLQLPAPPDPLPEVTQQSQMPEKKRVETAGTSAVYYTINITAVGWYNIDILMIEYNNCVASELMVRLKGEYKVDFNVTLIIPEVKAFIEGGKLDNKTDYGFDETNGKINLPQGNKCIVLAFAEIEGKVIFGKTVFNAAIKQVIDVSVSEVTKDQFKKEIIDLGLDDVSVKVEDSKNAEEIRKTDEKLSEVERLKPKNCNCDFLNDLK